MVAAPFGSSRGSSRRVLRRTRIGPSLIAARCGLRIRVASLATDGAAAIHVARLSADTSIECVHPIAELMVQQFRDLMKHGHVMNPARIDIDHEHTLIGLIHGRCPRNRNKLVAVRRDHAIDAAAVAEDNVLNCPQP